MKKKVIVKNISKKFKIGFSGKQSFLARLMYVLFGKEQKKIIEALKDVSFEVDPGNILGIIGENGSGKSTLLRVLAGIYTQDSGDIILNSKGRIISLINLYMGLADRLTMKENIYLCGSFFLMSNKEIKKKFKSIVEFSGLGKFLNTKLYQFSNGMLQRIVFSVAIHCDADILLLDEIFEVGDEDFKKRSSAKIKEVAEKGGCVLLVSHDLDLIKRYCHKVIWMNRGMVLKEGQAEEVIKYYKTRMHSSSSIPETIL